MGRKRPASKFNRADEGPKDSEPPPIFRTDPCNFRLRRTHTLKSAFPNMPLFPYINAASTPQYSLLWP